MYEVHLLSVGINIANVIILMFLLYVFSRNYRNIKSRYNIGLVIFSLLFLVENLVQIHLGLFSWFDIDPEIINHIMLINSIEFLGLLSMFYITWK